MTAPAPESYPIAFHDAVRRGEGVLPCPDRWKPVTTEAKFREFLTVLRKRPEHPLHAIASRLWRTRIRAEAGEVLCWVQPSGRAEARSWRDTVHRLISTTRKDMLP